MVWQKKNIVWAEPKVNKKLCEPHRYSHLKYKRMKVNQS